MPLVRVEVRNEYALGAPELYREANKEDPKEVLEGVAVAGLVGVLRQLGDLAEFAAEVFHGLQEEVIRTSSRSHKLMARVQRIETALSPLEKALLAQRSHLHFAYTAGSHWQAQIRCEKNHFIYSDVPQFIMDTYDDSRGPPRLHLLDKFDPGGPGSCLKRYSDPTFFKRASVASGEASADRTSKDKKGRKVKIRRSWTRSREVLRDASFSFNSSRMQSTQENVDGRSTASQTSSTYDATQRSDLVEQTTSNLRNGSVYVKGDFHPFNLVQPEEQEYRESISSALKRGESDFLDYNFLEDKVRAAYDDIEIYPSQEQAGCSSSSATWDEKNETQEPITLNSDNEGMTHGNINKNRHLESFSPDLDPETVSQNAVDFTTVDEMDIQPCDQAAPALESDEAHFDDIESETDHFMDALNTIESVCDTDNDCTKKQEIELNPKLENKGVDEGVCEVPRHNLKCQSSSSESNDLADSSLINGNCGNCLFSLSPKPLHATNWNEDEFNSVLCEFPIHNLERQSSSSESNDLANSPLLKGNCGNSLISVSPNSLHATNLNGDEFDSVSCEVQRHNLERRSSSSESNDLVNSSLINGNCGNSLLSSSSKSLHATNPNRDESNLVVCEVTRHNLECESSSSETAFVNSSLINDNCGNNLISLSPKSLHATNSSGDEFNSVLCGVARHNLELQFSNSEFNDSADSFLVSGNCGNNLISLSPKNIHATNSDGDEFNSILFEVERCNLELQSSCSESNDLADSSLINGKCGNTLISLSPKSLHATNSNRGESNSVFLVDKDLQLSQIDGDSWTPCSPPNFDSREENDNTSAGSNLESISCTKSSNFMDNNPGLPIPDGTRATIESQKHVPGTSSVSSVTFWTNGGLLGLQPSKPPDCSILNAKDAWQGNQTERFKHIEEDLNMDSSTRLEHQESSTSVRKTLWEIPPADLDTKHRKFCDSVHQNNSNITGSNTTSSRMFELSNKLLPTGSNKKLLPVKNQNFNSESRNYPTISNHTFSGRTKVLSPSSSPPLAHMKVSFQPINGFKTSKLKLKFPNRNTDIENGSDIFPSFQLVPELSITWQHNGSDSDADTFYRSSPSLSGDDSHSNQSESNSDQWESSESPTCTDRDLYDSLRRISLTESVSTVLENRLQNCAACRSFDIQSSGATNDSFIKGLRDDISLKGFVESQFVHTPAPSPLPPVEWQKSEAVLTNSVSMDSQPKPALFDEDRIDSMDVQKRKSGLQKSNGQRETNRGKSIDEKEDFLHQIRTKSFNLRPMVTTKPTVPSGGSANYVQVTAILEKAKAIRQAVGSDGEDDGHWSEA